VVAVDGETLRRPTPKSPHATIFSPARSPDTPFNKPHRRKKYFA
jgi:hypothetical protein